MSGIGKTIADLARLKRQFESLTGVHPGLEGNLHPKHSAPGAPQILREIEDFGPNPGNLRMYVHLPSKLPAHPALVVVLHGCSQTAAAYDHCSGWSRLADKCGFVVLYPEQQRANNPNTCFSWFSREDTDRDRGEARSIFEMIEKLEFDYNIDRSRIFINGLSAGGAMTSVMLAAYPDVFAGGAIIAGLPYGSANNVQEAFQSMFQGKVLEPEDWGDHVRSASKHEGTWPKISIWHGTADATVKPINAVESLKQWQNVHGVMDATPHLSAINGHECLTWKNAKGEDVIEYYSIANLGHGTPLDPHTPESLEAEGPYMLDAGISSTLHIAKFFGILKKLPSHASEAKPVADAAQRRAATTPLPVAANFQEPLQAKSTNRPHPKAEKPGAAKKPAGKLPIDVEAIISKALRSAGLTK